MDENERRAETDVEQLWGLPSYQKAAASGWPVGDMFFDIRSALREDHAILDHVHPDLLWSCGPIADVAERYGVDRATWRRGEPFHVLGYLTGTLAVVLAITFGFDILALIFPEQPPIDSGPSIGGALHDMVTDARAWMPVPAFPTPAVGVSALTAWGVSFGLHRLTEHFDHDRRWIALVADTAKHYRATQPAVAASAETRLAPKVERRLSAVRAALDQLDQAWLDYQLDLEAVFLTKPLLRDPSVGATAAYNTALYELRACVDTLTDTPSETVLAAAELLAEKAWTAWDDANDYAASVGLDDRSPSERAALRRAAALVRQLADPATPREMWPNLTSALDATLRRITTVPVTLAQIRALPALVEAGVATALPAPATERAIGERRRD